MLSLQGYLRRLPRLRISQARLQISAAFLGAAFAYLAFAHYEPSESRAPNFDETVGLLGLAVLCLAVVVWDGARPNPTTWPARLTAFLRRHWWEFPLLLSIVGFAVFIRTFQFGEFPPSGFICCEENGRASDAYDVIRGARPLEYFFSRYPIALGFQIFGENTLGIRLINVILAGVTMIPVFYLLLRQLVRAPAALFATALLASAWPLTQLQGPWAAVATLLFAYLLVLGIRNRNTPALLGAGLLAGMLSYEWGPNKAAPIVAGGFLAALAAYRLAFPLPNGVRAFLARLRTLVTTHWRSAVVFVGAALIVVTPLLVASVQGESTYLGRLDEAASAREAAGTPGIIAPNWEEQLELTVKMFTNFGLVDPRFGAHLVDPLTGRLVLLGVILGVVTFFRPFRLLFLAWYLSVIVGGSLILFGFTFWRFFGALLPAIVLVAFLTDDVGRVVGRWARRPGLYLLALLLLGGAIYVAYWNADTLSGSVESQFLRKYEEAESPTYALCNYLRGRDDENFSFTFNRTAPTGGFARPHETPVEQRAAWRDLIWACHDLRGQALASAAEVWPMRNVPSGPLTWAFVIASDDTEELVASMGKVVPSKTEPDRIIAGPGGVNDLVAYELSGQELKAQQGLFGQYRSGEGETLLAERVDDVRDIQWDAQSGFTPPFTVQWRGLIYLPQARRAALTARTSDPTLITVDGQVSYSSLEEEPASFPRDLLPGWHPVEISLHKETPGGSFALEWVRPEGLASSIARQDLFALSSLEGWTHEREVVFSIPLSPTSSQRFDFAPHFSAAFLIKQELQGPRGGPVAVTSEKWSAVWHVQEGREYQLQLKVLSGAALVKLDGATVLAVGTRGNELRIEEAAVTVGGGEHRLEIQQFHGGGVWTGASFDILAPDVPDYVPEFSPY